MKSAPALAQSANVYRSPQRRVVLFVIALALAVIASIGWKVYDSLQKERSIVRADLLLQSQTLGAVFESAFESAELSLQGVSNRLEYLAGHNDGNLQLRRRLLRAPSLKDLRLYGPDGRLLDRGGMSPLENTTVPNWVSDEAAHGRVTGFGHAGGELAFYRVVLNPEGRTLGTVFASVDQEYFQGMATQSIGLSTQASALVDPGYQIVMSLNGLTAATDLNPVVQTLRQHDAGFDGQGTRVIELGEHLIVIRQLRSHPLRLVQMVARDQAFAPWRAELLQGAVLAAFTLLAAMMFLGYWLRSTREHQSLLSELHRKNLVIEQTPVSVVITDLQANIVYTNPAFTVFTGYAADEALGRNPRILQSGKVQASIYGELWHCLSRGLPWRGILHNRRKDGSEFWEESVIAPLRDLSGRITHYFAVKIDVSQRKLAEDQLLQAQLRLQASQDLLDRLSQHVPGAIFQFKRWPDGHASFPYASEGIQEIFESSPAQLHDDARPAYSRLHPDDAGAVMRSIQESAQTLAPWAQEYRVILPAKGERWLSGLAKPVALADRSVLWHGFIKDVTDRRLLEQTANEHLRDLNTILDNSSVGISFVRARRQVWANRRMCEMFGQTLDEMRGQDTRGLYVSQQAYDHLAAQAYPALARGERFVAELQMRHQDGHAVWMRLSGKAVDAADLGAGTIWIFEDITEQKRTEADLRLAASVFTHAREGIMITDAAGTIVDLNETFSRITGYSRDEALGQNPRLLGSGRQGREFYAAMWHCLVSDGYWHGEIWNRRKNGETYAEMLTISAVRDADGVIQNYVALFSDISLMKAHEQELEHIAHYDSLTRLPNRVLLADRLSQAILQSQRQKKSLAVVFLDLDGFKAVNDAHGHAVGDVLLVEVAQRIKAAMREGDTLARIGGDEFVAILSGLEQARDLDPVLTRMLVAASEPVLVGEVALRVSASMGVTRYPHDGADADLLIRHADQAMYAAKQAGKHRYHLFDVAEDAAIKTRRESLERIRQALDKREFVLHYQPKVDMGSGEVVGVEALIRWNHTELGLLEPALFLPGVVDHPVDVALGEWVIDAALAQLQDWQDAGLDLPVSVNISAHQLQSDAFCTRLTQLLAAHPRVRPQRLELEVLESNALQDLSKVGAAMIACQALGVRFALDDFGTGYSSLSYLRHLPVATLKIDQGFVRDMLVDASDLAIVSGVIGLAKAFDRQVIAEGVQTVAHGERLLAMGCRLAQGFAIARPMPAQDLVSWLSHWTLPESWANHAQAPQPVFSVQALPSGPAHGGKAHDEEVPSLP